MKNRIATLLVFTSSIALSMNTEEKKEELKKQIIIKHQNEVDDITFSEKQYITFSSKTPEIYDQKTGKIIKTVTDPFYRVPLLNEMKLFLMAFNRKKDDKHFCTLYNLEEDTEKAFNTFEPFYLNSSFVLFGRKLLTPSDNKKGYSLYDVHNEILESVEFNDYITNYYYCPSKVYLSVFLKNNHLFCSNLINNRSELVTRTSQIATFSPDSTLLAYFDYKEQTILLYDVTENTVVKGQKTDARITEILFPTANTVWYTADQRNYIIWNIEYDTKTSLDLGAKSNPKEIDDPLNYFLPFKTMPHHKVYSFEQKKLYTLDQENYGTHLIFNEDENYAAYTTNNNLAVLYDTTTWKEITKITFENGWLNPFTYFSPDGQFLAVPSIGAKWIKLYDIKKDAIIFESTWSSGRQPRLEFHPSGLLIFTANDTTLIVYDYIKSRITKIDTKSYITTYGVHDDTLAVSEGMTSTLFTFKDLQFSDYIKEDITGSSSKFEMSQEEQEWLEKYLGLRWYTNTLAACQTNETTIVIYHAEYHTKAEVKKNSVITRFTLTEEGLTLFFENGQEHVALKDIVFENIINKKGSCIIA